MVRAGVHCIDQQNRCIHYLLRSLAACRHVTWAQRKSDYLERVCAMSFFRCKEFFEALCEVKPKSRVQVMYAGQEVILTHLCGF